MITLSKITGIKNFSTRSEDKPFMVEGFEFYRQNLVGSLRSDGLDLSDKAFRCASHQLISFISHHQYEEFLSKFSCVEHLVELSNDLDFSVSGEFQITAAWSLSEECVYKLLKAQIEFGLIEYSILDIMLIHQE
jgi:hypothetical protein